MRSGRSGRRSPARSSREQSLAGGDPGATILRPGALAKLDKAPASKVGDSRFESWVPRSTARVHARLLIPPPVRHRQSRRVAQLLDRRSLLDVAVGAAL